jgi:hypothetical protein
MAQLEDDAMRRDFDGDGIDDNLQGDDQVGPTGGGVRVEAVGVCLEDMRQVEEGVGGGEDVTSKQGEAGKVLMTTCRVTTRWVVLGGGAGKRMG